MNKKLHKWAMEQFKVVVDSESELRAKQADDRRFAALDQWPADIKNARENDPNGPRPCLTIDKISQYRQQIVNEMRKNCPSAKVRPVDDKGDVDTAKVIQEHMRHIEQRSNAPVVYGMAGEWAVDVGEGYFRFVTEQVGDTQEILQKAIPNRFSVYMGRHLMPDGSDAKLCFITEDMALDEFRAEYPKAKYKVEELEAVGDLDAYWQTDEKVRVAELFYIAEETRNILVLEDGDEMEEAEYWDTKDERKIADNRAEAKETVSWLKMTSAEILEERDFPCKYIPVVKVVGNERIVDGKIDRWGIIRPAKDSQRLYNYWASVLTEGLGLTARNKWLAAAGQIEGFELQWKKSNTSTDPFLTYNPIDVNGQPVAPPVKVPAGSPDVAILNQLKLIEHDIQTSLGMFRASVGEAQGEQSGRAIRSLQSQSDTATFHFPDNLAISVRHGCRIMIDMIPRVKDVRSTLRLLGEDGKPGMAEINPEMPEAKKVIRDAMGNPVKTLYNPGVGEYDVVATVGPSYATKRMEASEFLMEMVKGQPELLKIIGHVMFREMDINGADEVADIFERMLPPQLRKPKDGSPQLPPEAVQQITQLQQQLQMAMQELQKEKSGAAEAQMKIAAQHDSEQKKIALSAQTAAEQLAIQRQQQEQQAQLAREKAEADMALKSWIAHQDIELERAKAIAADEHAARKAASEREIKQKDAEAQAMPQVAESFNGLAQVMQGMTDMLAQVVKAQQETTAVLQRPKKVSLGNVMKDAMGQITGADVMHTLQ